MGDKIIKTARTLRKNQTEAEKIMWDELRNRKFHGKKFLRQYPLYFFLGKRKRYFIADFYSSELKLVLEIDGKIHESQKKYDDNRTRIINGLGIKVLRYANDEVINDLNKVLSEIKEQIEFSSSSQSGDDS